MNLDETHFKIWLVQNKKLSKRSADDVLSRVKRVSSILGGISDHKIDQAKAALIDSYQYLAMKADMKSQLKRSLLLLCDYVSEHNKE